MRWYIEGIYVFELFSHLLQVVLAGDNHLHLADLPFPALQLVLAATDLKVALVGHLELLFSIAVQLFLGALNRVGNTCF